MRAFVAGGACKGSRRQQWWRARSRRARACVRAVDAGCASCTTHVCAQPAALAGVTKLQQPTSRQPLLLCTVSLQWVASRLSRVPQFPPSTLARSPAPASLRSSWTWRRRCRQSTWQRLVGGLVGRGDVEGVAPSQRYELAAGQLGLEAAVQAEYLAEVGCGRGQSGKSKLAAPTESCAHAFVNPTLINPTSSISSPTLSPLPIPPRVRKPSWGWATRTSSLATPRSSRTTTKTSRRAVDLDLAAAGPTAACCSR